MSTVLSGKMVRTRKDHKCWGCGDNILTGSTVQAIKTVDEGEIHTTYWCDVCQEYWDKNMSYDDEVGFGDLRANDPEEWERIKSRMEVKGYGNE